MIIKKIEDKWYLIKHQWIDCKIEIKTTNNRPTDNEINEIIDWEFKIKEKKAKDINDKATLSDQLNLMAWIIDVLADELIKINPELEQNPLIIQGKNMLSEIKVILNR